MNDKPLLTGSPLPPATFRAEIIRDGKVNEPIRLYAHTWGEILKALIVCYLAKTPPLRVTIVRED